MSFLNKDDPILRGLLNTNRHGGLNKAYNQRVKKFDIPDNPLELEQFLDEMIPVNEEMKKKTKAAFEKLKEKADGDKNKLAALDLWEQQTLYEGMEKGIKKEFMMDFYKWLLGKGQKVDHQKTPWGNQRVIDEQCLDYIQTFFDAKMEWMKQLALLVNRANGLGGLEGIDEHFIFFKYIVRGHWEDLESSEFLYDLKKINVDDDKIIEAKQPYVENLGDLPYAWDNFHYVDRYGYSLIPDIRDDVDIDIEENEEESEEEEEDEVDKVDDNEMEIEMDPDTIINIINLQIKLIDTIENNSNIDMNEKNEITDLIGESTEFLEKNKVATKEWSEYLEILNDIMTPPPIEQKIAKLELTNKELSKYTIQLKLLSKKINSVYGEIQKKFEGKSDQPNFDTFKVKTTQLTDTCVEVVHRYKIYLMTLNEELNSLKPKEYNEKIKINIDKALEKENDNLLKKIEKLEEENIGKLKKIKKLKDYKNKYVQDVSLIRDSYKRNLMEITDENEELKIKDLKKMKYMNTYAHGLLKHMNRFFTKYYGSDLHGFKYNGVNENIDYTDQQDYSNKIKQLENDMKLAIASARGKQVNMPLLDFFYEEMSRVYELNLQYHKNFGIYQDEWNKRENEIKELIDKASTAFENAKAAYLKKDEELMNLQKRMEEMNNQVIDNSELLAEINGLQQLKEQMESNIKNLNDQITNLQNKESDQNVNISELTNQMDTLKHNLSKNNETLNEKNKKLNELSNQNKELEKNIKDLKEDLKKAQYEKQQLQKNLDKKEKNVNQIKNQNDDEDVVMIDIIYSDDISLRQIDMTNDLKSEFNETLSARIFSLGFTDPEIKLGDFIQNINESTINLWPNDTKDIFADILKTTYDLLKSLDAFAPNDRMYRLEMKDEFVQGLLLYLQKNQPSKGDTRKIQDVYWKVSDYINELKSNAREYIKESKSDIKSENY